MSNTVRNYIILAIVVVVAVFVLMMLPKPDQQGTNDVDDNPVTVTDFESCAQAGYPVMESYPRKCAVPGGPTYSEDLSEDAEVILTTPVREALVTSPLGVMGKAKNSWFFEANIPVTLKDSNGKILAQKGAQAIGDWMQEGYVDFSVNLEFDMPTTEFGVLIISKDNPSGLPENDSDYAIPVRFK
jgi:hypothetical protein